jgi:hypothetical protein
LRDDIRNIRVRILLDGVPGQMGVPHELLIVGDLNDNVTVKAVLRVFRENERNEMAQMERTRRMGRGRCREESVCCALWRREFDPIRDAQRRGPAA